MSCDLLEVPGLPPSGLRRATVPGKRPAGRAERPGRGDIGSFRKTKTREGRWEDSTSYITPREKKRTHYIAKKLFGLRVEARVLQDKDLKCYITAAALYTAYIVIHVTPIATKSVAHTATLWPQYELQAA